ncbi:alpha-ketoacid dehydrogenase kinase [Exidia glandulosa HHB12029]|uniref:Protein-serine/threonine kinase n=1 Tax=Exidia glandulosa HHB12029 TaxID=1314781 RepID=A0A165MRU6_EXIGL|nr:alpha-ketoacid dehydrogenase kinase [Exidia glandulosa HHB12029]
MAAAFRISPALWDKIHHFASFPQTGVSLQQMVLFGQNPSQGTLFKASQFLQEELPIRLAHRVRELDQLPYNLHDMPSINKVKHWYAQSFEELINAKPPPLPDNVRRALTEPYPASVVLPEATPNPSLDPNHNSGMTSNGNGDRTKLRIPMNRRYYVNPKTDIEWPPEVRQYNTSFTRLLEQIKRRHDPTVTTVAQGVNEWKRSHKTRNIAVELQDWLDRFYMSRIGIRFLIGQHVALNTLQPDKDYVGIICTNTNVYQTVNEAKENARFVCEEHYGMVTGPPVQLICPKELSFAYVPGHLSHICFELLKNSLRAVVEYYGANAEDKFPPIKVVVVEGREDITIKISDEGGGIPRSAIPLIWTYMYTTMENQGLDADFDATDFQAPMAGFGYGLPLSRLYARYFGGDLKLISMEGYGTDVYIHLNRLSSSREPLP